MEVEAEEACGGAAAADLEGRRGRVAGGRGSGGGPRGASSLFPLFPSLSVNPRGASSLYPPQFFFCQWA